MKINLESGQFLRNGYVNISSSMPNVDNLPENTQVAIGNFRDLKPIVGDKKVEEIIFNPPLNVLFPAEIMEIFSNWKNSLDSNGILKVNFIDITRLGKQIHAQDVPLQDLHGLIFGQNYQFKSIIDSFMFKAIADAMKFPVSYLSAKDCLVSAELKNDAKD